MGDWSIRRIGWLVEVWGSFLMKLAMLTTLPPAAGRQ